MGVNFNTNDPSKRQAGASIFSSQGRVVNDGPILREKAFQSKIVKGEVLDVDYKPVGEQVQDSSEKAKQRRLASQANNAKVFLSHSRPGTNYDADRFETTREEKAVDSLSEWNKVANKNKPESLEERLTSLESQVAELKELLISGKKNNEQASIYQDIGEQLASNPNARYMSSDKQYSGFIPSDRFNPKTLDVA